MWFVVTSVLIFGVTHAISFTQTGKMEAFLNYKDEKTKYWAMTIYMVYLILLFITLFDKYKFIIGPRQILSKSVAFINIRSVCNRHDIMSFNLILEST